MGCNISVDETMVGFRGRFAAKQYMPKKPQKWGIKAFMLVDSSTGYINNILMYMGSETLEGASSTFSHLLQPARVVMELMEPYLGRGHHLFTNRYYTSVQMAKALYDHQTAFTGVSKKNRTEFLDEIRQLQRRPVARGGSGGSIEPPISGSVYCAVQSVHSMPHGFGRRQSSRIHNIEQCSAARLAVPRLHKRARRSERADVYNNNN